MFTKQQLTEWRAMGFEFDDFYDSVAVEATPKIVSIEFIKEAQKTETQKNFIVKINLDTFIANNKLIIEIDQKIFSTYQKNDDIRELNTFFANVFIDFSTIARLNESFNIAAKIIDMSNKIIETKSIIVNVDSIGNVGETAERVEDGNVNIIGCGIEYRDKIKCYRYNSKYGPAYLGSLKMSNYSEWDDLVASGKITNDEKDIIIAMSENEGNLDAINGYDDQIVSIGAMQKTVNKEGHGELPIQIWEFSLEYPEKYKSILLNCGWRVEEEIIEDKNGKETIKYKIYYNDISENVLYKKIRNGFSKENQGKKVKSIPLEPLIKLAKDSDFQAKQIEDFIDRLNKSIQKKPSGYSFRISEIIKSNLGKATVLDHDINRPAHVSMYFGEALDKFFKENKDVDKNTDEWGDNHILYEKRILEIYGPLRGKKIGKVKHPMTDANNRYLRLKAKL